MNEFVIVPAEVAVVFVNVVDGIVRSTVHGIGTSFVEGTGDDPPQQHGKLFRASRVGVLKPLGVQAHTLVSFLVPTALVRVTHGVDRPNRGEGKNPRLVAQFGPFGGTLGAACNATKDAVDSCDGLVDILFHLEVRRPRDTECHGQARSQVRQTLANIHQLISDAIGDQVLAVRDQLKKHGRVWDGVLSMVEPIAGEQPFDGGKVKIGGVLVVAQEAGVDEIGDELGIVRGFADEF